MNTTEFIKLLTEADPSGKLEVVVNNAPILVVDKVSGFEYGLFVSFELNEDNSPKKVIYSSEGEKILVLLADVEGTILDNPNIEVDFKIDNMEDSLKESVKEAILKNIEDYRNGEYISESD